MTQHFVKDPAAVAAWKKLHKKTDKDLGAALRAHEITVNRWINGVRAIPFPWAKLLCEVIGVGFADLIEERLTPPPQRRPHPAVATAEQVIETHRLPGRAPSSEARTA